MDRALKERIIGAVVLVVFVVLVVPVFLDGPEQPGEVQQRSIPLPGQSDQQEKIVLLPRDRSEPVPASVTLPAATDETAGDADDAVDETTTDAVASSPDDPSRAQTREPAAADRPAVAILEDDDEPQPAANEPDREAEPEPPAEQSQPARASPAASSGMWAVQLGSFSSEANANRLAAELKRKGFGAFLSRVPGSSGELLRVRVGPQENRPAAERMAERLQAAGYRGQVVPYR
ncbi:MAG: SPOR domain-containing protein [Pseudomonadota bacterium]